MARSSRVARCGAALTVAILMLAGVRLEAATSVTIAWDPNPEPEVTGYLVLYGTQPGVYSGRVDVGVRTECTLLSLSLIHISEPTRLLSISYAVFCLKKK